MKTDVSFVILSHNDSEMAINAVKSIKRIKTKEVRALELKVGDVISDQLGGLQDEIKLIEKTLSGNIRVHSFDLLNNQPNDTFIYDADTVIRIVEK